MRAAAQDEAAGELRSRLAGAHRIAVIGIGDELVPPDRLGMEAAREIAALELPGVGVFCAGTVPESMTGPVKRFRPDHILFLDAAAMGEPPGTVRVIDPATIRAGLLSPHALPLTVVMEYLAQETGATVTLLGIQPDLVQGPGIAKEMPEQAGEQAGMTKDWIARILSDLQGVIRDAQEDRAVSD